MNQIQKFAAAVIFSATSVFATTAYACGGCSSVKIVALSRSGQVNVTMTAASSQKEQVNLKVVNESTGASVYDKNYNTGAKVTAAVPVNTSGTYKVIATIIPLVTLATRTITLLATGKPK